MYAVLVAAMVMRNKIMAVEWAKEFVSRVKPTSSRALRNKNHK